MPSPKVIMGHKRNVHTKADFKQRLSLKPIQTFDRSDVGMLDMSAESAVAKTVAIPRSIPPHLLMTSILEQICHSYVKDPVKAQQLFKVICEQLSKLKIISPLSFMDEMRSLRVQHRMLFQNLLRKALDSINKDEQMLALPSTLNVRVERMSSTSDEVISSQTSRYKSEFEELGRLGKGGYGSVFKARNHLDGRVYAVKKIRFRKKNMESLLRLLREVKALAKLSHTHIVGYNGAWMEYDSPHVSDLPAAVMSQDEVEDDSPSGSATEDSPKAQTESDSIIFDFGEGGDIKKGQPDRPMPVSLAMNALQFSTIRITEIGDLVTPNDPEGASDVEAIFLMSSAERGGLLKRHQSYSSPSSSSKDLFEDNVFFESVQYVNKNENSTQHQASFHRSISCNMNSSSSREDLQLLTKEQGLRIERNYQFKLTITLYIQMELCTSTLQDWMTERNSKIGAAEELTQNCRKIMHIFHQILQGVDYIHSNGMIHRDLKPRNIFMQADGHVKIGDFGLAKDYIMQTSAETLLSPSPQSEGEEFWFDSSDHTLGVGTKTYAAPEQMKGTVYDSKCDMYSLGVILFEMCQHFKTDMERIKTIEELRCGKLPDRFILHWKPQTDAVKSLTDVNPSKRPSTKELLRSRLFLTAEQRIKMLEDTVAEKDAEIKQLRQELKEKERQLREKVQVSTEHNKTGMFQFPKR